MSARRGWRPGALVAAVALVGGLAVGLGACSSSTKDSGSAAPQTIGPQSSIAESNGFRCEDAVGDLSTDVRATGTLSQPAGIDIKVAEAKVDQAAGVMTVTYQMAGDPNSAPSPFVDLLQGDVAAPDFTFELRGAPVSGSAPGGPWGLTLITFKGGEQRKALATAVTVSGTTVSYQVPLADIPPIATLQWTFGSSSTAANGTVTFDDCSSLTSGTSTTTAG